MGDGREVAGTLGGVVVAAPGGELRLGPALLRRAPGAGGRLLGRFRLDDLDGAVNLSGVIAEESGEALRPVQSGKVNQYGALLFGAAAVGAIVLVIINV